MSDNATVTTQETNNAEGQVRTFTQDEVNAIVGKRLAEEKGKYADYDVLKAKADKFDEAEEASKTELQKATERANNLEAELNGIKKANEERETRDKIAQETGVPANLLTGCTEDECRAQAEAIKAYATPNYPRVRDNGEVSNQTGGTAKEDFVAFMSAVAK